MDDRHREVCLTAQRLYSNAKDWPTFVDQIFGEFGLIRRTFKELDDLTAFEATEEYKQVQQMVATLRKKAPVEGEPQGETRVITIRLPKTMHAALKKESRDRSTSMNKLCISKLLLIVDQELVPTDSEPPKKSSDAEAPSVEPAEASTPIA